MLNKLLIRIKVIKFLKKRNKNYRKLGKKYREKPVEPWAFIRVKNEIRTIESCLESIIPVIKKGVIGYHKLPNGEKDDGTKQYILEFCKKNPGFIPFEYEYEVIPADSEKYKNLEEIDELNRLDSYYNAVLAKIPKNEWFIKIDCDHIYDTEKLKKLMYLPKNDNDVISFSRMNLHFKNNKLHCLIPVITEPNDHWLLKNNEIYFNFKRGYDSKKEFYAWEQINLNEKIKNNEVNLYHTDLFNWHFPYIKVSRDISDDKLKEFSLKEISIYTRLYYHISKDMINKDRILEICRKFKIDKN